MLRGSNDTEVRCLPRGPARELVKMFELELGARRHVHGDGERYGGDTTRWAGVELGLVAGRVMG